MAEFAEGSLKMTVPDNIPAYKFDTPGSNEIEGLAKVDFIIEEPNRLIYVEIKDTNDPDYETDAELARKCRDTFVFQYANGSVTKKIHYCVLFGGGDRQISLPTNYYSRRADKIAARIPPKRSQRAFFYVEQCKTYNLETWNNDSAMKRYQVFRE